MGSLVDMRCTTSPKFQVQTYHVQPGPDKTKNEKQGWDGA